VAELAYATGTDAELTFRPTTNRRRQAAALIIYWMLANPALARLCVPDSSNVLLPAGDYPDTWPLDHRVLTARFDFQQTHRCDVDHHAVQAHSDVGTNSRRVIVVPAGTVATLECSAEPR
jgi:hypothetical protein